ncbi:MAG: hypothetical protein ACK5U4_01770, partial [Rhodospirillales bacterium]
MPPQLQASTEARAKRVLSRSLGALAKQDEDVAEWLGRIGKPAPRIRTHGFEGFLRAIGSQQVSIAAASGIWKRLEAGLGEIRAERLLEFDADALRSFGLSRQ